MSTNLHDCGEKGIIVSILQVRMLSIREVKCVLESELEPGSV